MRQPAPITAAIGMWNAEGQQAALVVAWGHNPRQYFHSGFRTVKTVDGKTFTGLGIALLDMGFRFAKDASRLTGPQKLGVSMRLRRSLEASPLVKKKTVQIKYKDRAIPGTVYRLRAGALDQGRAAPATAIRCPNAPVAGSM